MNYKPFNLEQAKAQNGEGLITRDGRPARIVCWDRKTTDNYPLVGVVTTSDGTTEYLQSYMPNGRKWGEDDSSRDDLFMAPIKREGWVNVYNGGQYPLCGAVFATKEEADVEACSGRIACIHIEWEE